MSRVRFRKRPTSIRTGTYVLGSSGSSGAFVAKYSAVGSLIWAASLDGMSGVCGRLPGVRAYNGDVLVAGRFSGTADFVAGPGVELLTSTGGNDAFVSRLDAQGRLVWAKAFGEPVMT